MGFFESLGAGLGFGAGGATGWNLANRYVQPPTEHAIGSEAVGNATLTVMQRDAWGLAPHWKLYAIWDGQADQVGYFETWPELQAGIQVFTVYLRGGGYREHFWAAVEAQSNGTPPPALEPVLEYPALPDVVDLDAHGL